MMWILCCENENEPIQHYRMKRQTYGLKSSAYCCIATLKHCALEHRHKYPLASKAVLESFYVDDGTLGAHSDFEAEKLYRELNEMLMSCGFPLAKWATNSAHMKSVIGIADCKDSSVSFGLCQSENTILGLKWSLVDDTFRFHSSDFSNLPPTKRNIVASVAKLYDPNGWVAPIVVLGKILIQDVWKSKVEWDDVVPLEIQNRWDELKRKCPSGMKVFVGNRIAEAQECSKGAQWRHVRTHDNPADLASRGLFANDLVDNSFWFHGPRWLSLPQSEWPISDFAVDHRVEKATMAEQRPIQVCAVVRVDIVPRMEITVENKTTEILMDRCSSMMKLVRVTARVLNFIKNLRKTRKSCSSFITHAEYLESQAVWIKYHQQRHFAKEIELLQSGKNLSRDSLIVKMSPFIDGDGLLRVGGRIKRSMMPYDTKHPIILHHDGRFSYLLALEAHHRSLHGGNQLCLQYIRQRFWMISVRKVVKKVSLKCMPCFRQRKQVADQLMGDLPSARVISGYPFESVGVDYCGPVMVKERSGRCRKAYKAYISVFVCMKTRAVHLDLVTDLTSDAFMACLSRLVSLRGSIREIYSDNATTFHGAANEQREVF